MVYIVFFIFIIFFGLLNFYIGLKGNNTFKQILPFHNPYVYWSIFIFLAGAFIVTRIRRNVLPVKLEGALNLIGSYWIGAFSYLLILFFSVEIIMLVLKLSKLSKKIPMEKAYLITNILVFTLTIILVVYGSIHALNPKTVKYEVEIDKAANGRETLNTAMVSDIHLGEIVDKNRLRKMVKEINELNPDVVLLAGDIIDDDITPFDKQHMEQELLKINSKYGVYGVLGNHDYMAADLNKALSSFKASGITMLQDEAKMVDNSFYIVGRKDVTASRQSGEERKSLENIVKTLDKSLPIILMDHQPTKLGQAPTNGIDLQFSGHTHGGQYFPGNLFTKNIFEDHWGYIKKGNSNIIVSSGYGTWGPPIRIATNSEIISTRVKFKGAVA